MSDEEDNEPVFIPPPWIELLIQGEEPSPGVPYETPWFLLMRTDCFDPGPGHDYEPSVEFAVSTNGNGFPDFHLELPPLSEAKVELLIQSLQDALAGAKVKAERIAARNRESLDGVVT